MESKFYEIRNIYNHDIYEWALFLNGKFRRAGELSELVVIKNLSTGR